MAKYYSCSSIADIKAGLIDYYGAYDAGTNSDGVLIHTDSSSLIIFSCSAVSDKVIKITGYADLRAYFGDAYSGSDITNPTEFGGSTTIGSTTATHLVCGDAFVLVNVLASTIVSRLWVIGQLTNNAFAVIGMIGVNGSDDHTLGFLTADKTSFTLKGLTNDYVVGSKRAIYQPIIVTGLGAVYSGTSLVSLKDIYSISMQAGNGTVYKGTGYFITTSGMFTFDNVSHPNYLMVEVSN